jgi:hypothetical protein
MRVTNIKHTFAYTDIGPMKITKETRPWSVFECYEYPKSCQHCPMGWNENCKVDCYIKSISIKERPDDCPLKKVD